MPCRAGPVWYWKAGWHVSARHALFCQCKQDSAVPGRCINGAGAGRDMRVKWRETHGRTTKPMGCWILGETRLYSLGCKRNKHVYERIARDLEENGYERTWSQC